MDRLTQNLLAWYQQNKRDLPWRHTKDPYRIMVSEIMLQQTRVDTVIDYYHRFLGKFPTIAALADAQEDEVLNLWKGLGYYSRARNLHKAAKAILHDHQGVYPDTIEKLKNLPGVGEYTAGAIMSIAFNQSYPAVDGNVLRLITRIFGIDTDITLSVTKRDVTGLVRNMIPSSHAGDFTQSFMDLGSMVCTPKNPLCGQCPVMDICVAYRNEMTDKLPVKKKKEKQKAQYFDAFLIIDNNRILLTRNSERGLLRNLWGVPLLEKYDKDKIIEIIDLTQRIHESTGVQILSYQKKGKVKHVFTHRIWEMDVLLCNECFFETTNPDYQWIPLEETKNLPIPTAFTKVLNKMID